MPVTNLFGPPEPEDKTVVGTADVINYFPKINLQGRLLWEQRPGLTAIQVANLSAVSATQVSLEILAAEASEPGSCIPTSYAWVPLGMVTWDFNVDGTLHGDILIQPEIGVATLSCYYSATYIDPEPEGKKWTITGIYRNDSNSKIGIALDTMIEGDYGDHYEFELNHALTSTAFHINLTSLYITELRSQFIIDPGVEVGEPLPDTENWIECIRLEENDFGAEAEATVIYD